MYQCMYFISALLFVCRCKSSLTGDDFYGAYDAQDFATANSQLIGVTPVPSLNLVYTEVYQIYIRSIIVQFHICSVNVHWSMMLKSLYLASLHVHSFLFVNWIVASVLYAIYRKRIMLLLSMPRKRDSTSRTFQVITFAHVLHNTTSMSFSILLNLPCLFTTCSDIRNKV